MAAFPALKLRGSARTLSSPLPSRLNTLRNLGGTATVAPHGLAVPASSATPSACRRARTILWDLKQAWALAGT